MIRVSFAIALFAVAGCTDTTLVVDLSVLPPGCRAPESCYARACSCLRSTFETECVLCDPRSQSTQTCDCSNLSTDGAEPAAMCLEMAQVCVGRAALTCPGAGARCVPAGGSCSNPLGVPPDVVAVTSGDGDAGASTEQRCAYADDVCCPGISPVPDDLGVIDANFDQSVTD